MVWREWPTVAALLAVAAAMLANPRGLLRATENFMQAVALASERLRAQLPGFALYPLAPRPDPCGFPPCSESAVRIAGACLAAAAILAFLGSA